MGGPYPLTKEVDIDTNVFGLYAERRNGVSIGEPLTLTTP